MGVRIVTYSEGNSPERAITVGRGEAARALGRIPNPVEVSLESTLVRVGFTNRRVTSWEAEIEWE